MKVKFDKELYEFLNKNYNQSINIGEPYIFLKDYKTYKKGQIVYPFQSSPIERRMVDPVLKEAIDLNILVKQNDLTKINSISALKSENIMTEGLATKIYGKSDMFFGRKRTLPFMIVGAIVGGYYAKSKSYSTILGAIVGGAIPLVLLKLLENYDRSKLPYQAPKSKIPMPTKEPESGFQPSAFKQITKEECEKQGKQFVQPYCITTPCNGFCVDKEKTT